MTNDSTTSTPSNRARSAQSAANDDFFLLVPGFCVTAPELREEVDLIADRAVAGQKQILQAITNAPAEMHPLLNDLSALFGLIGYSADSTSDDIGTELAEAWGVAAA